MKILKKSIYLKKYKKGEQVLQPNVVEGIFLRISIEGFFMETSTFFLNQLKLIFEKLKRLFNQLLDKIFEIPSHCRYSL